jgi:predicted enzyme related to lactoylglutathione lyase
MHRHHAIDCIEFTVNDLARARRFDVDAFGWRFTEYGPDDLEASRARRCRRPCRSS